jgi:hypothetical protein
MTMQTDRTTKMTALLIAALMTVATQGTMLSQFDGVAKDAAVAQACMAGKTQLTLETVTVTSRRS